VMGGAWKYVHVHVYMYINQDEICD